VPARGSCGDAVRVQGLGVWHVATAFGRISDLLISSKVLWCVARVWGVWEDGSPPHLTTAVNTCPHHFLLADCQALTLSLRKRRQLRV
jgi:hypothetical protein